MRKLADALVQLHLEAEDCTLAKFERYMEAVLSWNEKVNLTAITDRGEFLQKHFVDSLLCADFPELQTAETIIDVGTGAGFPGIPLAIVFPQKRFLLLDSLHKRIKILQEICEDLQLSNVSLLHARAEDAAHEFQHREVYDLCVSRAVANLAVLTEYCLPFLKKGGTFLAYKGPEAQKEIEQARHAVGILGGTVKELRSASLPEFALEHQIIVIEKRKFSPSKYPRKAGMPAKNPLK